MNGSIERMEGSHLLVSANRIRRSLFCMAVHWSVPVYCQCLLQWPVPVYRACTNWIGLYQAVAAGQCVPIRWSGKIQACHIAYLHVGQTVCDRSLLIACVQRATKYSHNISTILVFVPVGISWLAFDKGNVNGKRWYGSDGSAAVAMVTPHGVH